MNMQRKIMTALGLVAVLGAPATASATLFTFDPTGTPGDPGNINNVALIDQAPGTGYAVGGNLAISNFIANLQNPQNPPLPTGFTLHYQANLASFQFADTSSAFTNGTGGKFFNFVAGFGETVIGASPFPGTATFGFDSTNPINFFQIWESNSIANPLTGVGFGTGNLILSAVVESQSNSNFQVNSTALVPLDQSPNGNQWGTQTTVTGAGATDLVFKILSLNNDFFPDLTPGDVLTQLFFNNSQVTAFKQVDPSQQISDGAGGFIPVNGLGTQNGNLNPAVGTIGDNFVFQADGNAAITVPEPGTLALLGIGLAGFGFRMRKQKN